MSAIDLTEAVEAAARANYERHYRGGLSWENLTNEQRASNRATVHPVVTAAAPLIEAAVWAEVAADILEWGQQYVIGTISEPGHLRWVCGHDFTGPTCDTCFTNAGHAAQVAARIARGGAA
ncbi:hypothetical protein QUV83_16215 [Cellulomonas cellasea]|uniref:hypothetical protein n=1 Tax=Cellulomonas cellasea TaxID=43670 RepID=UPI0025A40FEC|nr:hypothetical protein [Cellulomonas cellasea]MDM8086320.1 hypothetical protein [Cellulomonas cellasea]